MIYQRLNHQIHLKRVCFGVRIFLLHLLLLNSSVLWAKGKELNPISKAYLKELSFLKAQKTVLQKRVQEYKISSKKRISQAQSDLKSLESELLGLQRFSMRLEDDLHQTEKQEIESDQVEGVYEILTQAEQVLSSLQIDFKPLANDSSIDELQNHLYALHQVSIKALEQGTQILKKTQPIFNQSGESITSQTLQIGRIALLGAFKSSPQSSQRQFAPLAPAGQGRFRVWSLEQNEDLFQAESQIQQAFEGKSPSLLPLVLYENREVSMEKKVEKTWEDELRGGGTVGYVIVGLGGIAFLFALWRLISLLLLGRSFQDRRIQSLFDQLTVNQSSTEQQTPSVDLKSLATQLPSSRMIFRVLRTTLLGLDKGGRNLGEEYGFEQLLKEQNRLERFGALIMVSASIAPLLGLLGTVSGMIATFDVITEFGTGDPRLLSGGISEALITTRLGLIVAIPTLFLGTLLNGHSQRLASKTQIKTLELLNAWSQGIGLNLPSPPVPTSSTTSTQNTSTQNTSAQNEVGSII